MPSYFAVAIGVTPESSWASTYPQGPIHATSTWPLASATEIPAQSVVATRSKSRPSALATWAKNGSYAFLVSVGVGLQGPHAEAKLALVLGGNRISDRHRERRERREDEGQTVGLAGL